MIYFYFILFIYLYIRDEFLAAQSFKVYERVIWEERQKNGEKIQMEKTSVLGLSYALPRDARLPRSARCRIPIISFLFI